MGDNADGHELLSVVAAVHHEGVGKTLNDGAVGLAEALDGIATGRVRQVDGGTDLDVVAVRGSSSLALALTRKVYLCGDAAALRAVCPDVPSRKSLVENAARLLVPTNTQSTSDRPPLKPRRNPFSHAHQDRLVVRGPIVTVAGQVLRQGDITDLDILIGPLVEQLDAANLGDDILGQDLVARRGGIDLNLSVVRHAGQQQRFLEEVSCCRGVMSRSGGNWR